MFHNTVADTLVLSVLKPSPSNMVGRPLKLPLWMRFDHIPHSDSPIENAHSAFYVTSVRHVPGVVWTFPGVYLTTSPRRA